LLQPVEIAVVLGLIGVFLAITIPSLGAYQRRQDARRHAQRIADTLGSARALAIKEGNPYYVLFQTNGSLQIVDDDDGDYQADGGEVTSTLGYAAGSDPKVTYYGALAGPPTATQVPEDGGGAIPDTGTTFPDDPVSGLPGVGFTARGFPVSLPPVIGDPPGAVGSGSGSYYVTDNRDVVYAATVLPLGGIRVRVFRPSLGDWH
jgi:type II secretory pathway pseudopilin PulG